MDTSLKDNRHVRKTKEDVKPWIRRIGRIGYMAKGIVYFLVGILTFMAVLGIGGKTTGTSGMFQSLAGVKFGEWLLWMIGIGLIGYICWVLVEAFFDPQNNGLDPKGLIMRTGYVVSGVVYGSLAYQAIQIAMHAGSGGGDSKKTISAQIMSQPLGEWIIGAVGVIIIGYGLYEFFGGITGKFMKKLWTKDMEKKEVNTAKTAGKYGLAARGIVLGIIGFFFIQTALTSDPDEAKGLDGALSELSQQPYGRWILGIIAVGLILYGVYQIVRGRYMRMNFGRK
ncbi:UNVERIFIED_CONTAM: DUF1206 domain-containing protein [Halobacillus marinus]|uniref:DUF1206 domain-containing protein n=1 Tax=Bacillaceae TaxID=186817 RepID=UPI0002A4DC87|nr:MULTISPECIES: DUF1206 domain-containing protein [Bacillaceae]ELK46438.1 hypothetical protein D479_10701 [Halobacillus sp. BAB-2008]QHT45703.1 DUF1206 domain-containing protein [Bacillus sp. SB49]